MRFDLLRAWQRRYTHSTAETLLRIAPAVAYTCAIHLVSSMESSELPSIVIDDRIVHFVEYAILGVLLMLALTAARSLETRPMMRAVVSILIVAALGILDEWHQSFVPGRDSSWKDVGFDILGASCAALGIGLLIRKLPGSGDAARLSAGSSRS